MRKTTRNYIIDVIFALAMLFQGVTGFVLWFVLPGGGYRFRGGSGLDAATPAFLFSRHTWLEIHKWLAVSLLILFAVHLIIHWQWIVAMTKSYFRQGSANGETGSSSRFA